MKIAVVGLGIAGLSIAARLAEDGHDVEGFDRFEPLHTRGSSHGDTRIIRLTPGEGDVYVHLAERAAHGWRAWEAQAQRTFVDWMEGWMAGPPDSAFVQSCFALGRAYGRSFDSADAAAAARLSQGAVRLPADWIVCRQPDCGVIRADDARAYLMARAADLGVRLCWNLRIEAPIEGPRLRIGETLRSYGAVIVAAGPWIGALAPELAPRLSVERRVVAWFDKPTDARIPVLCAAHEGGLFGMPTPDGRYKIGLHKVGPAVDPDDVQEPHSADADRLAREAAAFLPLCDPRPIRLARCLYTLTPDENFIARPSALDDRVLLVSCCSGHGFKYAPAFGDVAADWLAGRASPALDAFGDARRAPPAAPLGGVEI